MTTRRKPYDADVRDAERAFVAPYLTLLSADAGRRRHDLREILNAPRRLIRSGSPRRPIPHDLPPGHAVYDQARRWPAAGRFEAIVHDLRKMLRLAAGRDADPAAAIIDGRTVRSTPESGPRAGYDGYRRREGPKVHMAVDAPGHLLALHVAPASEQDRARAGATCDAMREVTGESVELVYADRAYTGEETFGEVAGPEIIPEVVKPPGARKGFVLLPRRWVVGRPFGWMARSRRLARDYERLAATPVGMHHVAFSMLMLHKAAPISAAWSP